MRLDEWLWTSWLFKTRVMAALYEETEESIARRERERQMRRLAGPVNLGGRPTKRDRHRSDAGRR